MRGAKTWELHQPRMGPSRCRRVGVYMQIACNKKKKKTTLPILYTITIITATINIIPTWVLKDDWF